jgi:hypothetical protein
LLYHLKGWLYTANQVEIYIYKRESVYLRINHTRKSNISVKMFISELGEGFTERVKERMMDLEDRCFLTRKDIAYRFDLKHVEHLQYKFTLDFEEPKSSSTKEYAYGQFVVLDGVLYFSDSCHENKDIMQSAIVSNIYNDLGSEGVLFEDGRNLKRLNDNNIDFVIDSILSSCPQVSQSYLDIVQGMVARANSK